MGWTCRACGSANVDGTRFCGQCGAGAQAVEGAAATPAPDPTVTRVAAEDRRLVTVLFADVAGFTSLAEQLDPEQLVDVMDPVLGAMSDAIRRYGGTVSKFAGDAVLGFFGVPIAHDDDAVRAVLAARDMHREIVRVTATLPRSAHELRLHIGVNSGHVVTGQRWLDQQLDYSVLGDTVNTAQRLEAAAPIGETYVGELTHDLVGDAVAFDDVGKLTVKGKLNAVQAWRVRDEPRHAKPAVRAVADRPAFVGRERQLDLIHKALERDVAVVGLVGEAGVGKSRLLEAVQEHATSGGYRWVTARCLSYGATLAYRPYVDLLHDVTGVGRDATTEEVSAALGGLASEYGLIEETPYLVQLVGGAAEPERNGGLMPEAVRQRLHRAVAALLEALAVRQPVIIAVEDLHWMDEASLELTQLLVSRAQHNGTLVVTTLRPEGRQRLDTLTAATSERLLLELPRLGPQDVGEIIRHVLRGPVRGDLRDLIVEHTGGNPLFVEEIARALRDSAQLIAADGGWTVRGSLSDLIVPPTIEAVLSARIDLLAPSAARVLHVAAVIGREVPLALLARVVGLDPGELRQWVEVLVARGFIDPVSDGRRDHVVFHHALVVGVAYSRLLRRQRRDTHRRLVEVAPELYGDDDDVVDLLAHHAYHGELGEVAIDYLVRAAHRAARLYANREAITHLSHAIEIAGSLAPTTARVADLLLDHADLLRRIGDYEGALESYERAMSGEPVSATVGMAEALRKLGRYQEAQTVTGRAESLPSLTREERAALMHQRGAVLGYTGSAPDSAAVLVEALGLVEGSGSLLEATVRVDLARALELADRATEAVQQAERAVAILEGLGETSGLPTALRVLGGIQSEEGALTASLQTLERALSAARRIGHLEEAGAALVNIGCAVQDDDPQRALDLFTQALEAFRDIDIPAGVASAYANMADVLLVLGQYDEAAAAAHAGLVVAREIEHKFWISGCLLGLASAALADRQPDRALAFADEAATVAEAANIPQRADEARSRIAEAQEQLAGQAPLP